jgi:hypothetical protein
LPKHEQTNQNKIDLLFLLSNGTLVFIEVKRTKDQRARANEQNEPEVLEQLCRYRQCLNAERDILEIYEGVLSTIGRVFGRQFAVVPTKIFSNVPLLFVGSSPIVGPRRKGKDVWLGATLQKADQWKPDDKVIPINGSYDPADGLRKFFERMHLLAP